MDIDVTILFQLGLFLFCLVTLNGLILKPVLRVLQEREQKIEGASQQVEELTAAGNADMQAYQFQMRDARRVAERARDALRSDGRDEERRLLAATRADIAVQLNEARQRVASAELEARASLSTDTDALALQLVAKVLGREVGA